MNVAVVQSAFVISSASQNELVDVGVNEPEMTK